MSQSEVKQSISTRLSSQLESYLQSPDPSETLLMNELSSQLKAEGKTIYKFGFGQSPFSPPQVVVDALREHSECHDYLPVQGHQPLRESIASFYKKTCGIDMAADEVFIANGSKQLIFNIMAIFKEADVILNTPSWVSYEPQAKLIGHPVIRLNTSYDTKWHITPEILKDALSNRLDQSKPAIMILNSPGNPDGCTYSEEELSAIADVCREFDVLVIADEIYNLLTHNGKPNTISKFYPEATIVTTGLSKWCGAGGWRLGVALVPRSLGSTFKQALLGIGSETYSTAAAPVQKAAITAFSDESILTYISHQRSILSALGSWAATTLREAGIKVHSPEGGFYLFPDFSDLSTQLAPRGITSSQTLCEALFKDKGVALLPGTAFGGASEDRTARLAYVDFDGKAAIRAILIHNKPVDEAFLSTYCPNVVNGINAIVDWVQ